MGRSPSPWKKTCPAKPGTTLQTYFLATGTTLQTLEQLPSLPIWITKKILSKNIENKKLRSKNIIGGFF